MTNFPEAYETLFPTEENEIYAGEDKINLDEIRLDEEIQNEKKK